MPPPENRRVHLPTFDVVVANFRAPDPFRVHHHHALVRNTHTMAALVYYLLASSVADPIASDDHVH
jgi:hypothetical protein